MTRGPLPTAVYWRRRAFVLGLFLALVLLGMSFVRDGPAPPESARQVASKQQPRDEPRSRHSGRSDKRNRKRDVTEEPIAPTAPVLAPPTGTCTDADIIVTPLVQGAVAGQPVTLTLRLRTATAEACTWHVSSNHLALKITSGTDEVWASRECPSQVPTTDVVVRRDVTSTLTMTWNARRSEEGCTRLPRWVLPGSFEISAAALGGEPDQGEFELAAPTPEVVTVPPKVTGRSGGTPGASHHHGARPQRMERVGQAPSDRSGGPAD